jgi:ribosomal protein S18 acetylase RimI-like enzyme
MSGSFTQGVNQSVFEDVLTHLSACDSTFMPPLSERVELSTYAQKLVAHAMRVEAWCGKELVGLLALYEGADGETSAYLTNVSVLPTWQGRRVASLLIAKYQYELSDRQIKILKLHVDRRNFAALRLYERMGFVKETEDHVRMPMSLQLS